MQRNLPDYSDRRSSGILRGGAQYANNRLSELTTDNDDSAAAGEHLLTETVVDSSSSGLKYLSTLKAVQKLQRRAKLKTALSNRSMLSSEADADPASERTPLSSRLSAQIDENKELPDYLHLDKPSQLSTVWNIYSGKGVSVCLLAAPLAIWADRHQWSPIWIFWLNFAVMIPLASVLGDFTEAAAMHTNDTIGGLLNASFGNAVEVVVAIQALLADEIRVVQASMLGSIFSNLLLVLGSCFFFGGLVHKEQKFNATAASANMGLLALSSIGFILPTPFAEYYNLHDEHVLIVSRISAIFLMFMYVQLLIFQLKTHAHLFDEGANESTSSIAAGQEEPELSFPVALLGLAGTTLLITIFSELLVGSIDGFVEESGISRTFVGLILLPIVGNVVEHVTAVTVAMKDKMDLAMGVAVGSCTQVSLLVVPLAVLVGWANGKDMTLNFPHFEVILYIMSVLTVAIVLGNPRCNWLEGSLLMTTYALIAVGFWFEEVQNFS